MKNLRINKEKIISLIMAGTLVLSAYGGIRDSKRTKNDKMDPLPSEAVTDTLLDDDPAYINKYNVVVDLDVLNNSEFVTVLDDNRYTLCNGANIYYKENDEITKEEINEKLIVVSVIEENGHFAKVQLPNGEVAYVESGYLIKCINLNNHECIAPIEDNEHFLMDAYLYDDNGMYIGYIKNNQQCQILSVRGFYNKVLLDDGRSGYVASWTISSKLNQLDGFAYVKNITPLYEDEWLTMIVDFIDANKVIKIIAYNDKCCKLIVNDKYYYVNTNDLLKKFILIDITAQRMSCFDNFELVRCYKTRTGRDETPTHECIDDIDQKYEEFYFPKYPGLHAHYAIAYNYEYEEMIHDLVGDDVENYGDRGYQSHGSHGCTRVSDNGSKFVYDNYDVGDIVIVINSSQTLVYNVATNEFVILDADNYNRTRSK